MTVHASVGDIYLVRDRSCGKSGAVVNPYGVGRGSSAILEIERLQQVRYIVQRHCGRGWGAGAAAAACGTGRWNRHCRRRGTGST